MSSKPIQILALLGSGFLTGKSRLYIPPSCCLTQSGGNFYISAFGIPALLSPHSFKHVNKSQAVLPAKTLQTQWQHVYDTGKLFFPGLSVLTSSAYLYLAYNSPNNRPLYLVSAFSAMATLPYTFVFMMSNIKKIERQIKEEEDPQDLPRLRGEIATWAKLNYGRSALQFVAFLVGTWAVVYSA